MRKDPSWRMGLAMILLALVPTVPAAARTGRTIATIDLARPFATRSAWRFSATQGPDVEGPTGEQDEGPVSLCISNDNGRACRPDLDGLLAFRGERDAFSEPHHLVRADLVHPAQATTLLRLEVASSQGVNGDRRLATALLSYDRTRDMFSRIYTHVTGHNNNQEVRYIAKGPLRGAMISAEPTGNAPFGFWITVDRFSGPGAYRQVLRYRSATRYGDGNPLAVIDSEMPGIQQRLGLRRADDPLPLPETGCARPRMQKGALWC